MDETFINVIRNWDLLYSLSGLGQVSVNVFLWGHPPNLVLYYTTYRGQVLVDVLRNVWGGANAMETLCLICDIRV